MSIPAGTLLPGRGLRRPDGRALRLAVPATLLTFSAVGWWWSARMADDAMGGMSGLGMHETMSFSAFVLAWLAMMTAMMFPAISPVVLLYSRASAQRTAAPLPFFVAGYLVVWTAIGIPAYAAWRALEMPIADARPWAARLAGGVLIVAGIWQLTPLKDVCLRHCRSPLGFFMRYGKGLDRPFGAVRMGAMHGAFCVGCCWALMAVLVAVGTMNLIWMVGLAVLILLEKTSPVGEGVAVVAAVAMLAGGVVMLFDTSVFAHLT